MHAEIPRASVDNINCYRVHITMAHNDEHNVTTDHDTIKTWIKEHGGRPARVKDAENGPGLLRVMFDKDEKDLEGISWDEFFEIFEDNDLAFLYSDEKESRFCKFIEREEDEDKEAENEEADESEEVTDKDDNKDEE